MISRIVAVSPVTLVLTVAVLAGCSGTGSASGSGAGSPASAGYWTEQRLLAAQEFHPEDWTEPSAGAAPVARQNAKTLRVGALFDSDTSGGHFCTASVVDSPHNDVIVTAAHCLNSGNGGSDKRNVAFVPAYADGKAPYGIWEPAKYVMDPRWVKSADPDLDVAFVVLKSHDGKNIEQVLGANKIEFDPGYAHQVRVTGYPASVDAPIACDNRTVKQDPDYLEFACADFYGGTSGSPWVTGYNAQTRTGTIIGILGGYEEGGSTPDVSYSDYLGNDIQKLYDDAISAQG
jgi:V8-like Glu-specific endopeptidase